MAVAVIVGGGSGSRFGGDKLFIPLGGMPLIAWSLRAFERTPAISAIVVVSPDGSQERFRQTARETGIAKPFSVVTGGVHRHESVRRGLDEAFRLLPSADLVAIHDAARPLVTPDLITRCLHAAMESGAAAAAAPVTDTLHRADEGGFAAHTVDRRGLWAMQTPQVFRLADLTGLLSQTVTDNPTDEVSVVLEAGWRVPLVENLQSNIKVTWPGDLAVAEAVLKNRADIP